MANDKDFIVKNGLKILGGDLDLNNNSIINTTISFGDGTAASPSLHFTLDIDTGLYRPGADTIGFVTGGAERLRLDASGNVGIGLTSPSAKLDVQADANAGVSQSDIQITVPDTIGNRAGFGLINSVGGTLGGLAAEVVATGVYPNSIGKVDIFVQNGAGTTTALTALASGNVGIGTTSPGGKLHTSKGASGQATVNASADCLVIEDNADNGLSILTPSTATGSIFFGDESDNFVGGFRYVHPSNYLTIHCNNAERMRIDSSGNLGIGTSSPSQKLEVNGQTLFFDSSGTSSTYEFKANHYALLSITGDADAGSGGSYTNSLITNGANGKFQIRNGGNINFVMDYGTGDVGIGETSPSEKLHLSNNTTTDLGIRIDRNGVFEANILGVFDGLWLEGDQVIRFATGTTERMRIDSSGRVGIGTSSPNRLLELAKDESQTIRGKRTNSTNGYLILESAGTSDTVNARIELGVGTNNIIRFSNGSPGSISERMRINSSGNVLIGTTSAFSGAQLTITGNFGIENKGLIRSSTNGVLQVSADPLNAYASSALIFDVDGSEKARIDSSGNVGIGTTSPIYNFDCRGEGAFELYNGTGGGNVLNFRPSLGDANKYNLSISSYDHSGGGVGPADGISINGYDGVSICTGNSTARNERLRVTEAGNVGIGTTNTARKVHINVSPGATTDDGVRVDDGTNIVQMARTGSSYSYQGGLPNAGFLYSTSDLTIMAETSSLINFCAGGTERMRINSSGNVGIGTTTIPYKTTVAGDLAVQSASTASLRWINGSTPLFNNYCDVASQALVWYDNVANVERMRLRSDGRISTYSNLNTADINIREIHWNRGTANVADGDSQNLVFFQDSDTGTGSIRSSISSISTDVTGATRSSALSFSTMLSGVLSEKMRIDSAGNVGIGDTSPSRLLHLSSAAPIIRLEDTATGYFAEVSADNASGSLALSADVGNASGSSAILFNVDGSEKARINSSGNVGIGISSPVAKLDINGNVYIRGTNAGLVISSPASDIMQITTNSVNDVLAFGSGNSVEAMRIDSAGSLLVGITTNSAGNTVRIDKVGTANTATLRVANPLGTNSYGIVGEFAIDDTTATTIDKPSILFTSSENNITTTWSVGYGSGVSGVGTGASDRYFRIREGHDFSSWGNERFRVGPSSAGGGFSGHDFVLGYGQTDRGDSGASRALVKEVGNKLVVNYAGDYTGGVEVQSNARFSSVDPGSSLGDSSYKFGTGNSGIGVTSGGTMVYHSDATTATGHLFKTNDVTGIFLSTSRSDIFNEVRLRNISTTASGANLFVDTGNSNNVLRSTSSIRYKTDITSLTDSEIDLVYKLDPMTYKSIAEADDNDKIYFGFTAEHLDKFVHTSLVYYDEKGRPDGVAYDRITVLLAAEARRQKERADKLEKRLKAIEEKLGL